MHLAHDASIRGMPPVCSPPILDGAKCSMDTFKLAKFIACFSLARVALGLFSIGLACLAAFELIGGTLDERGVLKEPFGLVPIGDLLMLLGAFLGFAWLIRRVLRQESAR